MTDFEDMLENARETNGEMSLLVRTFTACREEIDAFLAEKKFLQSLFDTVSSGASLSAEQLAKLADKYPQLLSSLRKTDEGCTLVARDIIDTTEKASESVRGFILSQRAAAEENLNAAIRGMDGLSGGSETLSDSVRDAKNELDGFDILLGMLSLDMPKTAEETKEFSDIVKELTKELKLVSAAAEGSESAAGLSAELYAEIISRGEEYSDCIETQNGKLTVNIDRLKDLEAQEYRNAIAADRLSAAELGREAALIAASGGDNSAVVKRINDLKKEELAYQSLIDRIYAAGTQELKTTEKASSASRSSAGSSAVTDKAREDFEAYISGYRLKNERGLISDSEYYDRLEEANESFYKDCSQHLSDYEDNVTKIYLARRKLYKEDTDAQVSELDRKLKLGLIGEKEYAGEISSLAEKRYGEGSPYYGTPFAADASGSLYRKSEESALKAYASEYEKGISSLSQAYKKELISTEEYRSEYKRLTEDMWGEGSSYSGTDAARERLAAAEELLSDMSGLYSERLAALKREFSDDADTLAEKWEELNRELFLDSDPAQYRKNLSDIYELRVSSLNGALSDGGITPSEYKKRLSEINDYVRKNGLTTSVKEQDTYKYELELLKRNNDGSPVSERAFIESWKKLNEESYKGRNERSFTENERSIAEYGFSLLKREYGEGLIDLGELISETKKLGEGFPDIGSNLPAQWTKELTALRLSDEKSYWQERKKLVMQSYSDEIKKLGEISDEQERINRAEKLRTQIIKARSELEQAESRRSVLIFENGSFRYGYDQEKLLAAREKLSQAEENELDLISGNNTDSEKRRLEKESSDISAVFDALIAAIDKYSAKKSPKSDPELLTRILSGASSSDISALLLAAVSPESSAQALSPAPASVSDSGKSVSIGRISVTNDFHIDSIDGFVNERINELCTRLGEKIKERLPRAFAE